jgi:hypothetical protein
MIHDEEKYLAVNSAAAEMLGFASPADMVGLSPVVTSPPMQPGGIPTAVLAQQHIKQCLDHGNARFDWVAMRTNGCEIQVEVILTRLHAGAKFSDKNYRFSGGLHGVGVSVVNALSSRLEVWVRRDGNEYHMRFGDGKKKQELKVVGTGGKRNTGTTVRVWADS